MSIFMSELRRGRTRWSRPRMISGDKLCSEQNPILYVACDGRLQLIHTAQHLRHHNDQSWQREGAAFSMQWTAALPISLPNNNSSIQACRLSSGLLAMIYNRFRLDGGDQSSQSWGEANWPRTRWPLSIALSADDGDTWPWIRDIDTGLGFCGTRNWHLNGQLAYPTLLEGNPGELHLAYSWEGREAIRYVCLEESTIIGESNWS